jgi:hypothetical protein
MAHILIGLFLIAFLLAGGCASKPQPLQTGFLSDYSQLVEVDSYTARYLSPRAKEYSAVIVDPVESRLDSGRLSPNDRAEALRYMREACKKAFSRAGFTIVDEAGVGVARVQLALTDIANSTWWQKIHPGMRFSGAGTGGAAMEGEVIDSLTAEQLGAVVQSSSGNQFDITAFSTMADIKSAIDKWADIAARRLSSLGDPQSGVHQPK